VGEKLYSFAEEFIKDCAECGKNRYVQLITALRTIQGDELTLRGEEPPQKGPGRHRKLVEHLLKISVATTNYTCSIGFAAYRADRSQKGWDAAFCRVLMNGKEKEIRARKPCVSNDEAWALSDISFELNRGKEELASNETIHGVPAQSERYTKKDFNLQELARINFEHLRQPYLFQLCLELGLDAVVKPTDIRLLVAKQQDRIYLTGRWPRPAPPPTQRKRAGP